MIPLFLIALRNLAQHKKRTWLLGAAIAGVTALLTFLLCLSAGIHNTMLESATTLSTGHLNVSGFYKVTAGRSTPVVTQYKKLKEIVEKSLPDLDFVVPRGRGFGKLVSDKASMQVAVGGIEIENEPGFRRVVKPVAGNIDDLRQPNTVLIFEAHAKKLEVKVGDNLVMTSETTRGVSNTIDLRIVAIAEDIGILSAWNIFVPADSIRQLGQFNTDTTGALHVYLKNMKRIPQDMEILRKAFADAGYLLMDREAKPFWQKMESVNREDWTGQKLDLTTWEEEMTFLNWMVKGVDGLMVILTVVLLTIIAIGIMNSMWIAIRERTREIGTLRAIGMQRRRVQAMFIIEAFTLGAMGTFAGALLGILFAVILNAAHLPVPKGAQMFLMSQIFRAAVEPLSILVGMMVINGCTTLISIIPSTHAARLKPITAMSHIG